MIKNNTPRQAGVAYGRKKALLVLPVFLAVLILAGCSYQLPGSKKKEANQKVLIGSLWKTSDGGHTFEEKSQIDEKTKIAAANILTIAYHPKKQRSIYVSTVDHGIFKTEDAGEKWGSIVFPPKRIYSFLIDQKDPDNRMFASGVIQNWGKIFRTEDGGNKWDEVYTEPGQGTSVTAIAQNPKNMNNIIAGTSVGVIIISVDGGNTWKNVGSYGNNIPNGFIGDFAFDSKEVQSMYLFINGGKFYYSKDGGIKWLDWEEEKQKEVQAIRVRAVEANKNKNIALGSQLNKQASDLSKRNNENKMPGGIVTIAADPNIPGTVYAGTGRGFFRSPDYGKYWYKLNIIESAEKYPIRSIAVNPKNSKEIVFVAGRAFYKSIDGGTTWAVTGLSVDRDASFVSYDPFEPSFIFIGLRKF